MISVNQTPLKMSETLEEWLTEVTTSVNQEIKPVSDIDLYCKEEYRTYPNGRGDCEDYVLLKRRILMRAGISASDLLITVLKKLDGEGHAVLTVRTDQGDFILDNLNDVVKPWDKTGYIYLKRQAIDNTGRWVKIVEEAPAPLVGSIQ